MGSVGIKKELDIYLSKKREPAKQRKRLRDFLAKADFRKNREEEQLQALTSEHNSVVVINKEPNFFKVLHEKIVSLFQSDRK